MFSHKWCSMFIKFGIVYYEEQGKVGIRVTHVLNYDWIQYKNESFSYLIADIGKLHVLHSI